MTAKRSYLATKYLATEEERMELAQWWSSPAFEADYKLNGIGYSDRPVRFATNDLFQPKGCFQSVHQDVENYDNLYCIGNTLIMVLSLVNIVLFSVLLVVHIKANRRQMDCTKLLTKVKTSILVLIILLELSVFIRYTFRIESTVAYDSILIISGFVESIILFQICYFYSKKAAHFLEESKKIRNLMRAVMYTAVLTFFVFAIYQFWDTKVIANSRSSLCHTFYFILPNIVNQIANGFFFYIGCKVMQTINAFNSHQTALISPTGSNPKDNQLLSSNSDSDEATRASQLEIEFRKRAVRNMWFIIITIFIVDTYSSLYSVILYVWADDDCFVQDEYLWLQSLSTITQRSIQFVLWLYPIMWLFWPQELSCGRRKQLKDMDSRPKNERPGQDSLEEGHESSDEDPYDDRSSTSNLNLLKQGAGTAMFGGPSSNGQQTFMLLPNAAAAANMTSPNQNGNPYTSQLSSDNDHSSINSIAYKREGTFRVRDESSPTSRFSLNRDSTRNYGKKNPENQQEFSMRSPNSDFSDRGF